MSQEDKRNIIERETELVVVDENNDTHIFEYDSEKERKLRPVDVSPEIIEWVVNKTGYYTEKEVDFPISTTTSHHLEGTLGPTVSRQLQMPLEELIGQKKINYQSIEITENWRVDENGVATLSSVEYDGQTYTPE